MALFASYEWVSTEQFIADLATFASANGWTLDYQDTIRLHLSKNGGHFEIVRYNASAIYLYGCTGYDSEAAAAGQPGVSGGNTFQNLDSGPYYFVSSGKSLYFGRTNGSSTFWGGLATIIDKIGAWSGGFMTIGGYSARTAFFTTDTLFQTIFVEGTWSPLSNTAYGGQPQGLLSSTHGLYLAPAPYNSGIIPAKVPLFIRNASTTGLWHPVGFAPGIYICNPGDIYNLHDIITINGAEYLLAKDSVYFLIKLEA